MQQGAPDAKSTERSSLLGFITDSDSENAIQDGLAELVPSIQLRRASVRQATALVAQDAEPGSADRRYQRRGCTAGRVARSVRSGRAFSTRVLVVGDRADMNFYRSLTRDLGVAEYLYKPLAKEMVARMFGPACAPRGRSIPARCKAAASWP